MSAMINVLHTLTQTQGTLAGLCLSAGIPQYELEEVAREIKMNKMKHSFVTFYNIPVAVIRNRIS